MLAFQRSNSGAYHRMGVGRALVAHGLSVAVPPSDTERGVDWGLCRNSNESRCEKRTAM